MNLHRPRLACLSLFLNLELFWRNNKTIIKFVFRRIWKILKISEGAIHLGLQPRWISDTLLDLQNSSYQYWASFTNC